MLISCGESKQEKKRADAIAIDTSVKKSSKMDTGKNVSLVNTNDSIIIAKFLKDSIATTINGLLREAPQNVVVYINVKQGKNLSAILYAKDARANIRINQVFTPDGKADGPFGRELYKPIFKRGMYKLIIGHDLMAEGGSAVKFKLRIIVK